MYKDVTGAKQCSTCPAATISAEGSDEVTDCTYVAGFLAASDGMQCSACEVGMYKDAIGAEKFSTGDDFGIRER